MKKLIFITVLFNSFLFASLFDFLDNSKINESYKNKEYADTIARLYKKEQSAIVNYDLANCYYKLKSYDKALKFYKRALGEGVDEYNRLYNLGNTYYKLKEYKKAAIAYKEALKIKKDKDLIYNLKLVINKLKHKETEDKLKKEKKAKDKVKKEKLKKKSKQKSRKLTRKELQMLKKQLQKQKLKKELKEELKSSFKEKKVPIIMYKIENTTTNSIKNPW